MPPKSLSLVVGFAVLLVASVVSSQILKPRVLFERKSFKVVANDTFPKDLSCEVYLGSFVAGKNVLGSKQSPIFEAEGKKGRIENAMMHIGFKTSISVFRNDSVKDSYVLYLFTVDEAGKQLIFFDLNVDGEWDVKITPLNFKNFIRVENKWIEVDKVDSLTSKRPTAVLGQKKFVFQKKWSPLQ